MALAKPLLPFQKAVITELVAEDGLAIVGAGLGLTSILTALLRIYASPRHLVLLLDPVTDGPVSLLEAYIETYPESETDHEHAVPRIINNTVPAHQRAELYRGGGVLAVTSRILIVDLLNTLVPLDLLTGVVVCNAHRVTELCVEAFILRVIRAGDSRPFVKAVTDHPEALARGFANLEKTLRHLHLSRTFVWPRIHVDVSRELEARPTDVCEIRAALTPGMEAVQNAVFELMEASLALLRKMHPAMGNASELLSMDAALLRSFDVQVRAALEVSTHKATHKSRRVLDDLKTLRTMLAYLTSYSCVSFYSFLQSLAAAQQTQGQPSSWLFMDAANTLFQAALERMQHGETLVLEPNPKWQLLSETLSEIRDRTDWTWTAPAEQARKVLIVVNDRKDANQIADLLRKGARAILERQHANYEAWRTTLSTGLVENATHAATASGDTLRAAMTSARGKGRKAYMAMRDSVRKRQRVGGAGTEGDLLFLPANLNIGMEHLAELMNDQGETQATDPEESQVSTSSSSPPVSGDASALNVTLMVPGSEAGMNETWEVHIYAYSAHHDETVLARLIPHVVVLYDPAPHFIRLIEVHNARHHETPSVVYFLMYENSVEEQRYLSTIRRERFAFERIFRERATMAPPVQEDYGAAQTIEDALRHNDTRIAGGQIIPSRTRVIVDVREFRSSLPSILHKQRMEVVPVTLEVGDYILTPQICVERKTVDDLIGSLASGRLYSQAESMSAYYEKPVLLIEFDENRSFFLENTDDISPFSISSKLVLLTLHFPKLRILWSASPYITADMFAELKKNQDDPDPTGAANVGLDSAGQFGVYDFALQEMVQRLPGVTFRTYRKLLDGCADFSELVRCPLSRLTEWCGPENGKKVHDFLQGRYGRR